jgi:hypothetical protein
VKQKAAVTPLWKLWELWSLAVVALLVAISPASVFAKEPTGSSSPGAASAPAPRDRAKTPQDAHRFWDQDNDWHFAGVGASRTLDYFSTLNFRRRGRNEIFLTNDLVDNHPAFAAVEAGATGLSIGVSCLFHHYNHHKLERWTSIVHIGAATTGAVHNYCLKTAHAVSPATQLVEPPSP